MKITKRAFEAAVAAAADRRRLDRPVKFRTLTVDFEARTISDGRQTYTVTTRSFAMPILETETLVIDGQGRVL